MVKLVIQIPCYNEEKTLPSVLEELPKKIPGVDVIEVQIVDDGCVDKTVEVAQKYGAIVVSYVGNKGLGYAFKNGMEAALARGADILVNTDGDNQYPGKYIPDLVKPVLEKRADMVIGDRQTSKIEHFSPIKKFFQWLGSFSVGYLTEGLEVKDAVSGFRAYSRESMLQLNVVTRFSYCLDTIIQANKKRLKIEFVPITVNKPTRPSRLFNGMFQHIRKSAINLMRVYIMYEPFRTFLTLGTVFCLIGALPILRFVYHYLFAPGDYIQSLIIGAVIFLTGIQMFAIGIMAELNAINRRISEDSLYLKKKTFYDNHGKGRK